LNRIAEIHQHLSKARESLASLPWVCGNGAMRRHEDLGPEGFDRVQRLQPVEAVTIIDIEKLVGEKELAQIDDAILGNIDDAVPSCVRAAHIENLNLLAAEMKRDPIPIGLIGQPRLLLLR